MGLPVATYGAHERAQQPGGRDFGPEDAIRYGRRFKVMPEWLLTGRWLPSDGNGPRPADEPEAPISFKVPVVGYVGAGAKAHFYDVEQGELDLVDPPRDATEATVAVEIRGESLGAYFNRWLVFYDQIHHPVIEDLVGELCVVGLEDGRVLIKQIQRGRPPGRFTLISANDDPIENVPLKWAARVNNIQRRSSR